MKDIKLFFLLLSISLFSVNTLTSTTPNYIIDYATNGTNMPVDLSQVNDEYVYFSFNSTYHYEISPINKDIAFFSMISDKPMIKDGSVSFFFSEDEWDQIEIEKIINVEWKETKIVYKENIDDNTKYYYKIERNDKKYKTLLLRVATNNVKEGELTVTNENHIPSESQSISGNVQISKLIYLFLFILNIW